MGTTVDSVSQIHQVDLVPKIELFWPVNVRKAKTPLPPTFASVHTWVTPPPPYSANVICTQPLNLMINAIQGENVTP